MSTGASHDKQHSDGDQGGIGTRTGAGGSMPHPGTPSAPGVGDAGNRKSGESQGTSRGKQGNG